MQRLLIATLLAAVSAGCSDISPVKPVLPASHDQIAQEYKTFEDQWKEFGKDGTGAAVADETEKLKRYVVHGYDLGERSCLEYFTRIRELRNRNQFYSDTLASVFSASGVIAALSGAASPILVGLFAGGGLVPNTVKSYNNIFLLAEVADDLYPAIQQAMADFRATNAVVTADRKPLRDKNFKLTKYDAKGEVETRAKEDQAPDPIVYVNRTLELTRWNATKLIRAHASMCSLPALTMAVNVGISNVAMTLNPDTGTFIVQKAPPAK